MDSSVSFGVGVVREGLCERWYWNQDLQNKKDGFGERESQNRGKFLGRILSETKNRKEATVPGE